MMDASIRFFFFFLLSSAYFAFTSSLDTSLEDKFEYIFSFWMDFERHAHLLAMACIFYFYDFGSRVRNRAKPDLRSRIVSELSCAGIYIIVRNGNWRYDGNRELDIGLETC